MDPLRISGEATTLIFDFACHAKKGQCLPCCETTQIWVVRNN